MTFWGSPWQPRFLDMAFNLERGTELREKWDLIPAHVDVLITHGPPQFVLDRTETGENVGCEELRAATQRTCPRLHVFGHIHHGHGWRRPESTLHVNASNCASRHEPLNPVVVVDLPVDGRLCRLCGWSGAGRLPSEATFSRAFSEFAESRLASRLHETLIARTMDGHLVEHISRDATAIEAREKPAPKPKAAKPKRRKRGRPRKGEARAKEPSRLERQLTMSLPQMLADLPRACDVGSKRNAKGHTTSWIVYGRPR